MSVNAEDCCRGVRLEPDLKAADLKVVSGFSRT
jgi:hypothetical protein